MKYAIFILLLLCPYASAADINPDLPELLDKIATTGANRWEVGLGEKDMFYLNSKENVFGEAAGYSFPPGEGEYTLHFRFKIVDEITPREAARRRQRLETLRKQGEKIKHTEMKGYFNYEPVGKDQWALALKIKKAEQDVEDIPEYKYKSVCLSEEYSMAFFIPNKQNKKALRYKKDIDAFYKLLKPAFK